MDKLDRIKLIEALEGVRESRVIAYLTADRGLATMQIAEDVLRVFFDHASVIGKTGKIDLLLYSRGGDSMLPWPLVNTLRGYCDEFNVLVPFKAHSAATMIALGADEIIMTPLGQLTPVEPTVTTPFNPPDDTKPGQRLGINVEDVAAYLEFVHDRAGIEGEEGRGRALERLTAHVNPVALGRLHRFHKLARMQAERLLSLHMPEEEHAAIADIVENVVSRLWAHEYRIGREEARALGLKVRDASDEEEQAIWALYQGYEAAMELRRPLLPTHDLFKPGEAKAELTDNRMVYIESTERTDVFLTDFEASRPLAPTPPGTTQQVFGPHVQVTVTRQRWEVE